MRTYEVFFFDLDGTITDSSLGITNSVIYALKRYGIVETDRKKLYSFIGPPLTESFQKYYGFSAQQSRDAVEVYREYYREKGIYENKVYDGFEKVAYQLRKSGKRLVVATSKPEPFARMILDHFNLTRYFEYIAGMELDGRRGTKEAVIRYALEMCRITEPGEVLMVGDREHDVLGARAVGIDCLGVLYGFGNRRELCRAGAAYLAEKPEDILRFAGK